MSASVAVDIVPTANSLDLYGQPNTHFAFSLSGNVQISIASPFSLFERRKAVRILLQSVQLTFDGQSEVITNALGYSSLRLCSITRELVSVPMELSNSGQEDDDEPARWNVVFDLPIPGWLPASQSFAPGDFGGSSQYCLHAVVKYILIDDYKHSNWSLSSIYSPFRSRERSVDAYKTIKVRRFAEPPTDAPVPPAPMLDYLLRAPAQPVEPQPDSAIPVPPHILSKIQILASVPQRTDICDNMVPFHIRLRTQDLEGAECKRLEVTKMTIDIVQEERCRQVARVKDAAAFDCKFPVAAPELQPPNRALLNPHNMAEMYQLGLCPNPSTDAMRMVASSSLLPFVDSGVHVFTGDTHIFIEDADKDAGKWYTMETLVPIAHHLGSSEPGSDWEGSHVVRPSTTGPLYDVSHALKLTISVQYTMPDTGAVASAALTFTLPLTMARMPPPLPPRDLFPALYNMMCLPDGAFPPPPTSASVLPGGHGLPVYSQLFDASGNRKVDDMPLPRYAPAGSSPDHPDDHTVVVDSCLTNEKLQPRTVSASSST
ncbi:hypothetical protein MKEN_01213600 [Mycena kentingensis (nom. inval.)]|nr:hypothetical protein MKEN_01213600 [Mycena kentingensis (nom. inval.)]